LFFHGNGLKEHGTGSCISFLQDVQRIYLVRRNNDFLSKEVPSALQLTDNTACEQEIQKDRH